VAFALGYQARTYFTSSPQAAKSIPSLNSGSSGTVDLTDKPKSKTIPTSGSDSDSESELDTDSEAEDLALALSSNPQSLKPTSFDEVKLVLIVNESLKMTKGKIAAQAGHATLSCALMMKDVNPRMYKHWERHGYVSPLSSAPASFDGPNLEEADDRQPKIALKCKDTEELEILAAKARSLNLCARTIQDA